MGVEINHAELKFCNVGK